MATTTILNPADTAVGTRSAALAARLERGASDLADFARSLTDAEWRMTTPGDGRTVGVIVHHVASVYPLEIRLAEMIAAGTPITGVTTATVDDMNAAHAAGHAGVTRTETLTLLAENSAAAAAAIRAMDDAALDRAVPVSLYDDAELTCQFLLEDHAVRHSYHHLARLRAMRGGR